MNRIGTSPLKNGERQNIAGSSARSGPPSISRVASQIAHISVVTTAAAASPRRSAPSSSGSATACAVLCPRRGSTILWVTKVPTTARNSTEALMKYQLHSTLTSGLPPVAAFVSDIASTSVPAGRRFAVKPAVAPT